MAIYKRRNLGDSLAGFMLKERNIYGSSMIGTSYDTLEMIGAHLDTVNALHHLGNKNFFLENHLGNVLATVSDKKIPRFTNGLLTGYEADIISSTDYYGFGQEEEGRNFNSKASRYGFNGMEKDNEISGGDGNDYTAAHWEYDPRLAMRWNLDPDGVAFWSPYAVDYGMPIKLSDPNGDCPWLLVAAIVLTADVLVAPTHDPVSDAKAIEKARHEHDIGMATNLIPVPGAGALAEKYLAKKILTKAAPQIEKVTEGQIAKKVEEKVVGEAEKKVGQKAGQQAEKKVVEKKVVEGRGKNNRQPNPEATGDHSTFNDRGNTTYTKNEKNPSGFDEVKRTDTKGGPHRNGNGESVPTPHTHEKGKDVRPAVKGTDY